MQVYQNIWEKKLKTKFPTNNQTQSYLATNNAMLNLNLAGLNLGPPEPKLRFMVGDKQNKTSFNDIKSNLSLD